MRTNNAGRYHPNGIFLARVRLSINRRLFNTAINHRHQPRNQVDSRHLSRLTHFGQATLRRLRFHLNVSRLRSIRQITSRRRTTIYYIRRLFSTLNSTNTRPTTNHERIRPRPRTRVTSETRRLRNQIIRLRTLTSITQFRQYNTRYPMSSTTNIQQLSIRTSIFRTTARAVELHNQAPTFRGYTSGTRRYINRRSK